MISWHWPLDEGTTFGVEVHLSRRTGPSHVSQTYLAAEAAAALAENKKRTNNAELSTAWGTCGSDAFASHEIGSHICYSHRRTSFHRLLHTAYDKLFYFSAPVNAFQNSSTLCAVYNISDKSIERQNTLQWKGFTLGLVQVQDTGQSSTCAQSITWPIIELIDAAEKVNELCSLKPKGTSTTSVCQKQTLFSLHGNNIILETNAIFIISLILKTIVGSKASWLKL